jgi:hypothetical protein
MPWSGERSWPCQRVSVAWGGAGLACLCHGSPGLEDGALGAAWLADDRGVGVPVFGVRGRGHDGRSVLAPATLQY